MDIRPVNRHILIKACEPPQDKRTPGGIEVPMDRLEGTKFGVVEAVDKMNPPADQSIKPGRIVYWASGNERGIIDDHGEVVALVHESAVIAVLPYVNPVNKSNQIKAQKPPEKEILLPNNGELAIAE